ncbi:hypothetical protein CBS147343_1005 [Aspergillus niger]|nr:hypothetical protein CBS133816_853 [Aspergillus niger]KAI2931101.1 hypothetical protein CBS147320_2894 [Aspergillus niger]KAI2947773.1 hypothetical protein CBS147321_2860 [Aspergillus niger]KAI2956046.1 hypothetical protein CBS147322_2934 [Aspergillus niger]KAI2992877.1 hypothetical protein CBS147344_287 [Aspergillus niger]
MTGPDTDTIQPSRRDLIHPVPSRREWGSTRTSAPPAQNLPPSAVNTGQPIPNHNEGREYKLGSSRPTGSMSLCRSAEPDWQACQGCAKVARGGVYDTSKPEYTESLDIVA